ncbi:MAG: hypothetical protein KKF30_03365 [Proteobacteria bacterium]|nr:hypothetical protein [Desulfobacteraceae bacterium]MBU4000958.1 hypothetical protein [Pseudomonadota bacterium]MBU4054421.1 hypothetical protein [Pseudomonadota bacterium]MBU4316294.1 hypothetical protein [Pseudomonadota bacterium]MBU4471382.1 hypothetical protein [Pseudomonadota bacterium]
MNNHSPEYGHDLITLFDLDGEVFIMENGYWVKFEARRVGPTPSTPHGVRYSLTLHDKNNSRIVGFDNAHAIKVKGHKRYSGRKITWDHKHHIDKVTPYEFESAGQLLDDFWKAVNEHIGG